jgi:hypothetical protein
VFNHQRLVDVGVHHTDHTFGGISELVQHGSGYSNHFRATKSECRQGDNNAHRNDGVMVRLKFASTQHTALTTAGTCQCVSRSPQTTGKQPASATADWTHGNTLMFAIACTPARITSFAARRMPYSTVLSMTLMPKSTMAQPSTGFGAGLLRAFRDFPAEDTRVFDEDTVTARFPGRSGAPSEGIEDSPTPFIAASEVCRERALKPACVSAHAGNLSTH